MAGGRGHAVGRAGGGGDSKRGAVRDRQYRGKVVRGKLAGGKQVAT